MIICTWTKPSPSEAEAWRSAIHHNVQGNKRKHDYLRLCLDTHWLIIFCSRRWHGPAWTRWFLESKEIFESFHETSKLQISNYSAQGNVLNFWRIRARWDSPVVYSRAVPCSWIVENSDVHKCVENGLCNDESRHRGSWRSQVFPEQGGVIAFDLRNPVRKLILDARNSPEMHLSEMGWSFDAWLPTAEDHRESADLLSTRGSRCTMDECVCMLWPTGHTWPVDSTEQS